MSLSGPNLQDTWFNEQRSFTNREVSDQITAKHLTFQVGECKKSLKKQLLQIFSANFFNLKLKIIRCTALNLDAGCGPELKLQISRLRPKEEATNVTNNFFNKFVPFKKKIRFS